MFFVFFFQAEDGIRDLTVTGVQTCALPIWRQDACTARRGGTGTFPCRSGPGASPCRACARSGACPHCRAQHRDRKSTRLNSSHSQISYAVFCLKKKKKKYTTL